MFEHGKALQRLSNASLPRPLSWIEVVAAAMCGSLALFFAFWDAVRGARSRSERVDPRDAGACRELGAPVQRPTSRERTHTVAQRCRRMNREREMDRRAGLATVHEVCGQCVGGLTSLNAKITPPSGQW